MLLRHKLNTSKHMNMIKNILLATITCLYSLVGNAQEVTFEELKSKINDKSLPLVNITVEIDKVSKPKYTQATIEIVDPQKRTDNENISCKFACKVKYRGSSSIFYDKKSFGVKLLDNNNYGLDANMFGIRKSDTWILNAMAIDRLRMRDRVNFDIWNEMSSTPYTTNYNQRNGTSGLFVELFINGMYHGLYCFSDKVDRKLLNLKKLDSSDDGAPIIKGVMYKWNKWSNAVQLIGYSDEDMYGETWNDWELAYPDDNPCPDAYMPIKDFIDYCASTTTYEFKNGINERFYLQNFADYNVFTLAVGLLDNNMKNTYLSIANIQKGNCIMVTPWDLDSSLGGGWDGSYQNNVATTDLFIYVGLYHRLWNGNVNNYKTTVAERWRELYKTTLSENAINARIDAYVNAFIESGAWQREYNKWNGNPVALQEDLTKEADYVKDWYKRNCANLKNNVFSGIASGVNCITTDKDNGDNAAFNLLGEKVDASYKGIVIVNGEKILRK